jgi:hypothetical protein
MPKRLRMLLHAGPGISDCGICASIAGLQSCRQWSEALVLLLWGTARGEVDAWLIYTQKRAPAFP